MKIWGVLCLLVFIGDLEARIIDVPERFESREENPGTAVVSHVDEEGSQKNQKAELSSLKENHEASTLAQEEVEKPDSYMIVDTADKLSPPGGGLLVLDPRTIIEQTPDLFPEAQAPWWESWWNGVMTWLFGESS